MNRRERAAVQFAAWRKQGVPTFLTGHEAHRLSGGRVGKPGDHWTPYNLAAVAKDTVR